MQVIEDDGTVRELEAYEQDAIEAAQRAHDDAEGVVRQYSDAKANAILTGILANMADIPVEDAMRMASVFPDWKSGTAYPRGYRIRYVDRVYTVLQEHTAQADWYPSIAASLYAPLLPGQDGAEAGEWVRPDSTNPYSEGDVVTHGGKTWRSLVDGNVWEPGAAGSEALWEEVADGE